MAVKAICAVENCGKTAKSRGWCPAHYQRWRRNGGPLGGRISHGEAPRFLREVVLPHAENGPCLIWPYGRDGDGYGRIWTGTKAENVCRLVCEEKDGPPPDGHLSAHSCGRGHEGCVNPHHLRWATAQENAADRQAHKMKRMGRFKD